MSLWVPPKVSEELRAGTAQYRREVIEQARTDATVDFWTRELRRELNDPYLQMIRAKRGATLMREGFYYILRHNPDAPPSLICVEGPDGEFIEPNSGIYELLRRGDMWSREANADREKRMREAEEAERRRKEREMEDRTQEIRERLEALTRTQVSMNRGTKWSQNVSGRRGVKADG